ncbi:hypothetical protein ACJX0J_009745, partial [Zea mays]
MICTDKCGSWSGLYISRVNSLAYFIGNNKCLILKTTGFEKASTLEKKVIRMKVKLRTDTTVVIGAVEYMFRPSNIIRNVANEIVINYTVPEDILHKVPEDILHK